MKKIILLFLTAFINHDLWAKFTFPQNFFFGVANAPGQIEDQLPDIWMEWADQKKIKAFFNYDRPKDKLAFWTRPHDEIKLAKEAGLSTYRMGIDWGRVMPTKDSFDENAIKRYKEIVKLVRSENMNIMMTLMHHSIPKWAQDMGGWKNDEIIKSFFKFSQRIIHEFNDDVKWWTTFNEGNVFVTMAYTVGIWPPGDKSSPLSVAVVGPFVGESIKAMDRMALAHNKVYDWAHSKYLNIKIGLAHNMAYYTGKNWFNRFTASFADESMNWRFPEKIRGKMDFFGFNFYGAEWFKGTQIDIDPEEEYSEAGRAIYPQGLYEVLKQIHKRFENLPIIITENGIGDSTDILRPSYMIEHLLAVHKAIQEGIPVQGYFVWSMTDNLEWSDGYCPKFGLVAVDRKNNLKRLPRESYFIFKKIVETHTITEEMREMAWKKVLTHQGKDRPFCRAPDGLTAYDEPVNRKIVTKDWRFRP